jgi:hypothetical protein
MKKLDVKLKQMPESQMPKSVIPDHATAICMNEYCGWKGTLKDCPTDWEQESWETEQYQIALCPECGEEVELL